MVRQKAFYQLHQFLQYHVVSDSKPLVRIHQKIMRFTPLLKCTFINLQACLLLSLEGVYPAAYQLALDMLKRLSTANDLIVEILINKQKIIPALRYAIFLASTSPTTYHWTYFSGLFKAVREQITSRLVNFWMQQWKPKTNQYFMQFLNSLKKGTLELKGRRCLSKMKCAKCMSNIFSPYLGKLLLAPIFL